MITLIIVNYQNDYISGTVLLKGAKNALEETKKFIKSHKKEIDKIIFAIKWHPYNHMSFKKDGGTLPTNCVQYTPGACIEPKFLKYVQSLNIDYEVSQRGEIEEVDEIGAFNDIEFLQDSLGSRYYFDSIATADASTEFIICGLGEESVISTINNLLDNDITPKILLSGIVSSDNNEKVNQFIKQNKLIIV